MTATTKGEVGEDQEWPVEVSAPLDVRTPTKLIMGDNYPRFPETPPRQRAEGENTGEWTNPLFPLARFPQFQQ